MSDSNEPTIKAVFDLSSLSFEITNIAETLEGAFFENGIMETERYAGFIPEIIRRMYRAGFQTAAVTACFRKESNKPLTLYTVTIEKSDEIAERA